MRRRICLVGFLVLNFFRLHLYAQDCTVTHYSVNDGLSQSSVYHFLEDRNGLMWIGTGDGLNLFNGYEFKVFKHQMEQEGSISNNTIRSINQDNKGQIWIGTENGLNKFDSISENFYREPNPSFPHVNPTNNVLSIIENKLIDFIPGTGIFQFDTKNNTFKLIGKTDSCQDAFTNTFFNANEYYLISNSKLGKFNSDKGRVDWYINGKNGYKILYLNKLGKGDELLIRTPKCLEIFNVNTKQINSPINYPPLIPFIYNEVTSICIDKDNNYWIAVEGDGLFAYTADGKLLKHYYDQNALYSFKHIGILYCDSKNNIWAGTQDAGFFKITLASEKFKLFNINSGEAYHISSNFIKCFYKHDNDLLVGTFDKGLNIINTQTGKIQWFEHNSKDDKSICSNTINAIDTDREGHIWICTEDGICLYNAVKKTFQKVLTPKRMSIDNFTPFVFQTNTGLLYTRLYDGLYLLKFKNKKWQAELYTHNLSPSIIWENDNGNLLMGYRSGGIYLSFNNKIDTIPKRMKWPEKLQNIKATCFYKDRSKNIWVATNMGLLEMDNSYHFIKLYSITDGLPDAYIYGILADKTNHIWLSTNRGISRFDIENKLFRNYSIEDGLQSNEYNSGAYYKTIDGEMYFGGVNGFNYFYPEKIKDNPYPPIVKLTNIKLYDKDLPLKLQKPNNKFSYTDNTFSFEVAGIEFTRPADITYSYKLLGDEDKWFDAGKKRYIRYSNLAPGNYTLLVKAANSDGIWSEPKSLYQFTIHPPYWSSWWFRGIIGGLFISITIGATRYASQQKLKKLLAQSEREREIEKIRTRISIDIHDDIGAGLSKLAMISENTKSEKDLPIEISDRLDKLTSSSRELMNSLSEIVWAMNPKYDQAESLLSYLRSYTYSYFEDSEITCIVNFPEETSRITFNPEIRRNIFLIVKEAFNNTLKYSKATNIEISFKTENKKAQFIISDNGIGIQQRAMRELGNGLINMRKRCEAIGGIFDIISAPGCGTKISLSFDLAIFSNS